MRSFASPAKSPQHAAQLLEALLPDDMLGLVSLTSLELQSGGGRGKDLKEFRSDLLFRASIDGSPGFVCFLFEHQSSSDGRMPLRVLGYQLSLRSLQAPNVMRPDDDSIGFIVAKGRSHRLHAW
jgi:hypothetical protein